MAQVGRAGPRVKVCTSPRPRLRTESRVPARGVFFLFRVGPGHSSPAAEGSPVGATRGPGQLWGGEGGGGEGARRSRQPGR